MKIALVILHADVARGGAERYTLDLAGSLVRRGYEVWILASSFQGDDTAGTRVLLAAKGITRTGRYLAFLDSLDAELKRGSYDIVHAMLPIRHCDIYHPHAGVAAEGVWGGDWVKRLGNRFNLRRWWFARIESELLTSKNPPVVFCLSHLIQNVVRRHYPNLPDGQMISLFNGTDLNRFDPAAEPHARHDVRSRFNIDPAAIVGLILAQDFERKGLGQIIEALARLDDRRLVLLVGGKQDPSRYRQLAKKLGVQHQVMFAGLVLNPADFYRAADFFVLPTRSDPCSLVVLEALAMGLPVISTVQNGACEIMRDGVHGAVLEDPDDISALAAAIAKMLDPKARNDMGDACLQLRPALSQASHLECLLSAYTAQIARKSTADPTFAR